MKKWMCVILSVLMVLSVAGCASEKPSETSFQTDDPLQDAVTSGSAADEKTDEVAVITIRDFGTIEVALDRSAAPETVDNFVKLAGDGFYNGLTFHRIITGFMIQGGDPDGNGTGGSPNTIKGEFSNNGIQNPISHVRGTISMARTSDPNSASSQFFIVHQDSQFLDGDYAGFGHVISGMDVVDAICEKTAVIDGNGTVVPDAQPVIESVVIK